MKKNKSVKLNVCFGTRGYGKTYYETKTYLENEIKQNKILRDKLKNVESTVSNLRKIIFKQQSKLEQYEHNLDILSSYVKGNEDVLAMVINFEHLYNILKEGKGYGQK